MAYGRLKTEMHGDTSRWGPRAVIKHIANRLRRRQDHVSEFDDVLDLERELESLPEFCTKECCSK